MTPASLVAAAPPSTWAVLSLAYVGVGAVVAAHLGRRGHGFGTACAALPCWPLLLGLVGKEPPAAQAGSGALEELERDLVRARHHGQPQPQPQPQSSSTHARPSAPAARTLGPNAARIDACLATLAEALAEARAEPESAPALVGLGGQPLAGLARALHRADLRLARADRLIAQTEAHGSTLGAPASPGLSQALGELRHARSHSQAELEAILDSLMQLRVQIGLHVLAGDVAPVRERLGELEARVAALAELSSMGSARGVS